MYQSIDMGTRARVRFSILALIAVQWTLSTPLSQTVQLLGTVDGVGLHLGLFATAPCGPVGSRVRRKTLECLLAVDWLAFPGRSLDK